MRATSPQPTVQLNSATAIAEKVIPQPTTTKDTCTSLHQVIKIITFRSLSRTLAVTTYMYRYMYVNNLCKSRPKTTGPLLSEVLTSAQRILVCICQENAYLREMSSIRSKLSILEWASQQLSDNWDLLLTMLASCNVAEDFTMLPSVNWPGFSLLLKNRLTDLILCNIDVCLTHAGVGSTLQHSDIFSGCHQYVNMCRNNCLGAWVARGMGASPTQFQS